VAIRLAIKGGAEEALGLRLPYYRKAADNFTRRTGIDVDIFIGADNDLAYRAQLFDVGEKADVMLVDSLWLPELAENGIIRPLDTFVRGWDDWREYHERAKELGEYNGKIYGIPHEMDTRGIFYRKDIVGKDWNPESLEEIIDTASGLRCEIPLEIYYGTDEGENAMCQGVLPILNSFGGKIRNGGWNVKSREMLNTLRYYREVFVSKKVCARVRSSDARELFSAGKIGILFDGMWCWNEFWGEKGVFPIENKKDIVGYTEIPGKKGKVDLFAGWVFSLGSETMEANELLKELCSSEVTSGVCTATAHVSPRTDSEKPEDEFLIKYTEMLDNAVFRPKAADYSRVAYQVLLATERVVEGVRPRKAMKALYNNVRDIGATD
jgi:multiple sugar transport system substrate-binding protein